ncbi:aldehyde dehydrogenase family protein [Paracoccus seriniphilus]|uniref:Aldehyde dehydrogenase (NAD+) n=1 Tax=Paracoccus seriniphilus TaxID=184748 RepID=A0A239PYV1_9RHOB|nr:aldehyde dehydrogenase family protein [Paracoccus seriniphilus]WCR15992.1 aldehyde dehydrogenase family protein [Paracoccus seriniphilus]SNT75509.1 aldehyde dehydrogenase (NAD+) [Paracoccus seriniphilus]
MNIKDIMDSMEYGPAPEDQGSAQAWLEAHDRRLGHFIDGQFQGAAQADIAVENPATGETLAHIPQAGHDEVDAAVKAAKNAFGQWSRKSGYERSQYLYAIARGLQKRERLFSVLETLDNGKAIRESRNADIPLAIRHFYHHAGWAAMAESEFAGQQPLGVCGQIIPWNFPLLMLAWKIAPALAAGNTVVLKPADLTPLTAVAFAELLVEIGLPKGVVNIVQGGGDTGAMIVRHPDIAKIAFTGSTAVGRDIRRATAGSGKRLTLELGGKSPFVICADADLDAAVEGVVEGVWFNQGEVCCAGSRLLIQEGIAERFLNKLRARMQKIRVGSPLDKSTDMGAIVSARQKSRIQGLLDNAAGEGIRLEQSSCPLPEQGHFVTPGFFADAQPAAEISQVEIFGPIAVTTSFRTIDEAVELANNTGYGLSASIWSENINAATELAARIKAGVVWINATNIFDANAPFGGVKESGYGREGAREGMASYLEPVPASRSKPVKPVEADLSPTRLGEGTPEGQIDRTMKNYIGGKQARPDGGSSYVIRDHKGRPLGLAPLSGRKDIRNAVEAARKAGSWSSNAHGRAQVLFFLAENIAARSAELISLLQNMTGTGKSEAGGEVQKLLERCFYYAGLADKDDGAIHATKPRHLTLSLKEPVGVAGVLAPDNSPLLGLMSLILPLIAAGNRVVAVPSPAHALIAQSLYQIFDTSDLPAGVVNLVSGDRDVLAQTLAEHDAVDLLWYHGSAKGAAAVEAASAGNLKQVWTNGGFATDWFDDAEARGRHWMARATQIKTIWVPYGA